MVVQGKKIVNDCIELVKGEAKTKCWVEFRWLFKERRLRTLVLSW